MTRREEIQKDITFAKMVISVIENVSRPMFIYDEEKEVVKKALMRYIIDDLENIIYDEEKEVVRKALMRYIDNLESELRGR